MHAAAITYIPMFDFLIDSPNNRYITTEMKCSRVWRTYR